MTLTVLRIVVFSTFALLLLGCETVTETLIINETGSGSLIVQWSATEEQFDRSDENSSDIEVDRGNLNEVVAEALVEDGYVLNDQVAFNVIRNAVEAGFSVVDPINDLDELAELNSDSLSTGRPPVLLWRDVELSGRDADVLRLVAKPSVPDRAALLSWGEAAGLPVDQMVFVAAFEVRGEILENNADEVSGNRLEWRISGTEERNLEVSWRPLSPESTSATPFVFGLVSIIVMIAIGLYQWESRNLHTTKGQYSP